MIRFLAIVLTLCVVAVLTAPFAFRLVDSGDRADRLLQDGQTRAEEGDWVQARVRFEEILSGDPENLEARLGLARALRDGGAYETAATHLLHIIDKAPDTVGARLEFGEMLFLAGRFVESRAQLDAMLGLGAEAPRIDALAAAHAAVDGSDPLARELAQAALEVDPGLSQAYATLAALDLRAGAFDAALAVLDEARAAGAESLSLTLLRLGIYEQTGREDEIGAELAALGSRHPATPELRLALARWILGYQPENTTAAAGLLGDLLRESADDQAETIRLTGEMIDLLGIAGARAIFEEAGGDAAFDGAFENQIAALEMASGDRAGAIARLEREIAEGSREETRNASRLLLARLLDPVNDLVRRSALAEAVLASDPENPSAHLLLSDADLRLGDAEAAIAHLRSALTMRPDSTDIILDLARAHALAGSEELAQDRLSNAVQTSGHAPELVLRYARLIADRQGAVAAAGLLDAGLEAHPRHPGLLVRRAQVALSLGDLRTAREMRARLGDISAAEEVTRALDQALSAQSEGPEQLIARLEADWTGSGGEAELLALGRGYLRQGRTEDALALLDGALAGRPDWVAARLMRADTHMAAGAFEAAETDLAHAAAADPENAALHAGLARLRLSIGREAEADAAIAAGLAGSPEDYGLEMLRARRLEMTGRTEDALAAFQRLARRAPGDPRVAARIGLLLSGADRSADDLRQAVRITAILDAAADPTLQEIRGWVLHRAGESARAVEILAPLSAERPNDMILLARLGLSAVDAGRTEQGRDALTRVLELAPDTDAAAPELLDAARKALKEIKKSTYSSHSN